MQVEYGFELTQDEAKDQQVCEQQTEQCGSSQHGNERWMAAQLGSGVVSNASSSRVVQVWLDPGLMGGGLCRVTCCAECHWRQLVAKSLQTWSM